MTNKIILIFIVISFIIGFSSNYFIYKSNKDKSIIREKKKILNLLFSNFVSYSQHFEDFILFFLFYNIQKGFYIDVGAFDPNFISVTKAFYERGWYGINIEPIPEKYESLKKHRKRDINLQIGVGEKDDIKKMIVNGVYSSILNNITKNNSRIINIKIKAMKDICKKYVPKNIKIQFCKIDVEKAEKYVLLGYDFINFRPKVFCIETLFDKKKNKPEYVEWEYILFKNDYEFGYHYGLNRFYYDKRINGLKEKFKRIDYYVKLYKK